MRCPFCGNEYQPNDGTACAPRTALLLFPTVGTKGKTWVLTQAKVDEWQELYPALDVLQECRKALAWIKAQMKRRKTPGGMDRMLVGWLNREVNGGRGSIHAARTARPGSLPVREWECPLCLHTWRASIAGTCPNCMGTAI